MVVRGVVSDVEWGRIRSRFYLISLSCVILNAVKDPSILLVVARMLDLHLASKEGIAHDASQIRGSFGYASG